MIKKKRTSLDVLTAESYETPTEDSFRIERVHTTPESVRVTEQPTSTDNAATHLIRGEGSVYASKKEEKMKSRATTYIPPGGVDGPVWDLIWQISLKERRRSITSIMHESIDMFLKSRGQPSIEEITGKKDWY